jgi:hypothetical protein
LVITELWRRGIKEMDQFIAIKADITIAYKDTNLSC